MTQEHEHMDLDQRPSRFHDLNNSLHVIAAQISVVQTQQRHQTEQAGRIEQAILAVNGRLDRFDTRVTDMEKSLIITKGEFEKQLTEVKSNMEKQVIELRDSMRSFSPVRMVVYGFIALILTAVVNVWITNALRSESVRQLAPQQQLTPPPVGQQ